MVKKHLKFKFVIVSPEVAERIPPEAWVSPIAPVHYARKGTYYPFDMLKVGFAFWHEQDGDEIQVRNAAYKVAKRTGKKFVVRRAKERPGWLECARVG